MLSIELSLRDSLFGAGLSVVQEEHVDVGGVAHLVAAETTEAEDAVTSRCRFSAVRFTAARSTALRLTDQRSQATSRVEVTEVIDTLHDRTRQCRQSAHDAEVRNARAHIEDRDLQRVHGAKLVHHSGARGRIGVLERIAEFVGESVDREPLPDSQEIEDFVEDPRVIEKEIGHEAAAAEEVDEEPNVVGAIGEELIEGGRCAEGLDAVGEEERGLVGVGRLREASEETRKDVREELPRAWALQHLSLRVRETTKEGVRLEWVAKSERFEDALDLIAAWFERQGEVDLRHILFALGDEEAVEETVEHLTDPGASSVELAAERLPVAMLERTGERALRILILGEEEVRTSVSKHQTVLDEAKEAIARRQEGALGGGERADRSQSFEGGEHVAAADLGVDRSVQELQELHHVLDVADPPPADLHLTAFAVPSRVADLEEVLVVLDVSDLLEAERPCVGELLHRGEVRPRDLGIASGDAHP